jgi:hypothetical protein
MPAQPSNSWTIQLLNADGSTSGAPATLASYGIESAVCDENNMAADVLTLKAGRRSIDAATLWPYGQLLAMINPSGIRAFFGRVEPWSREGTPDAQDHIGRVVNPWWYLANKIYQQRYNLPIVNSQDNVTGYTNYTTPRVVLYRLYNGAPIDGNPATGFYQATTGQQIQDAISWAISQGAPISLGQMDPIATPPSHFQRGLTCENVVKEAFRLEPDFNVVWDYTTLPFPTMHCLKQQSFTPLTIDLTTPGVREEVKIKERPDWQRSYVQIFYDETNSIAGSDYISLADDFFPNPLTPPEGMSQTEFNFRGVDLFCDLTGGKVGRQQQQAHFASQAFDITAVATWQKWHPHIDPANDPTIDSVFIVPSANYTIPGVTKPDGSALTVVGYPASVLAPLDEYDNGGNPVALDGTCIYEIVDGAWADWIAGGFGYTGPVYGELSNLPPTPNGQRVRATAFAVVFHKLPANAQTGENPKWEVVGLAHDFTATNINTNGISADFTSTTQTNSSTAEGVPDDLAEVMWNAWQVLAIEGEFKNVEAVIGSTQPISRKNCLNFNSANQPAWASVNAIIQKLTWDIGKGTTNVQFGAPLHLTGNALIDAIRWTRSRITTIDLAYIFGGAIAAGSGVTRFARKHHARTSVPGRENKQVEVIGSQPGQTSSGSYMVLDSTVSPPVGAPASVVSLINQQDMLAAWQANTTAPGS